MKILFVVPGMGYGGAERVISILANSFVLKKYKVKLLITNNNKESVYDLHQDIEIEDIEGWSKTKPLTIYKLLKNIRKIITEYRPSIIISFFNDLSAIISIANLGLGYPVIYSERNDPVNVNKDIKNKIFNYITQKCVNGFVFQSDGAKKLYAKNVQEKSVVILNPMEIKNIPNNIITERKKEIVSVGRLHPQKNQHMLIKSFKLIADEYPDYKLCIYGEGYLKSTLQNYIDDLELSDKVFLMGSESNILEKIYDASVFAFTSNYEGLPNALIEAMALGLPCISTDCSPGGAAMLIKNNYNGILVDVGDESKFANKLKYILDNPIKANEMGERAKDIVNIVDEKKIIKEWEKFIFYVTGEESINNE